MQDVIFASHNLCELCMEMKTESVGVGWSTLPLDMLSLHSNEENTPKIAKKWS
jgi:hypothetical protein